VVDVTGNFLWQEGRHQVLHIAGEVLTGQMKDAPHDAAPLARLPVVGVLVPDEGRQEHD
jgi:predicted heme/steroid binding protein